MSTSLSVVKTKRKVSCLPCRLKKVKCDGEQPKPCQRCLRRNMGEQCTYVKTGQVGRPPKNAVVNKLILNRPRQHSKTFCKEFIFENIAYSLPTDIKFFDNDKFMDLNNFIDSFRMKDEAIMQLAIVRLTKAIPCLPDIVMYDILELYSWAISEVVNVIVSKISIVTLENFGYFDSIAAAVFQDMALKFFSEPAPQIPIGNPLSTLSSQQAIHLIDTFFSISPHSILLNKTLILQGYWTDSLDPWLLCVIYGTTTYLTRLLDGQPVRLWEATNRDIRNPFLDYAYFMLQRSSSTVSFAKFQAATLLGLFESMFGHPKRGMRVLGLAFAFGGNLGVTNGSFQAENSDIDTELANVTFWALFVSSARGSVDLGHVPHFSDDELSVTLPPSTIERSPSYQFEESSGNVRSLRCYYHVVETFYIQSVLCKYTCLMLRQFPELKFNLYKKGRSINRQTGLPDPIDLVPRLRQVLQEFYNFIEDNKKAWSIQQIYTIEMAWSLYDIHLTFTKKIGPFVEGVNFTNSTYDIFQDIPLTADDELSKTRVQQVLPRIYQVLDKTNDFLSDPDNYRRKTSLIPRGLIVTVLETCFEILFLGLTMNPNDKVIYDYMEMVKQITEMNIWIDWSTIDTVRNKVKAYLSSYNFQSNDSSETPTIYLDDGSNSLLKASFGTPSSPSVGSTCDGHSMETELGIENDMKMVAFFDPCATWLDPMTVVDLKLLDNNGFSTISQLTSNEKLNKKNNHPSPNDNTTFFEEVPNIIVEPAYLSDHHFDVYNDNSIISSRTESSSFDSFNGNDSALYMSENSTVGVPITTADNMVYGTLFDQDPFM
ncbi:uncharacterized protein BX664DRAFT_340324 [Halteromyces radiatus]|uniref:uncharacterized protein n=1 Tax=Halteromyces radiatus TaxID=101107 RepID=UPI0022204109|nr:uncharacterized protein BX664DRAFT_340324 [Halteromyces radiatus]KAI8081405.1 hypothetical protein BX664DRAFT_340324 [Halteromyces radiatus]